MGENIGAAARAMMNFGLAELRLVNPRDGWPNQSAIDMAAGAFDEMAKVKVFKTLAEATADLNYLFATTVRPRDMAKPVVNAQEAAKQTRKRIGKKQKVGYVFGPERTGLENDDVALCHAILTIPTNPNFSSLNLGQSVLLAAYEYSNAAAVRSSAAKNIPAQQKKINEVIARLEDELETGGFFKSKSLKPTMRRNIRAMLARAEWSDQEVRTFHGIISALKKK
jgi:tRNA/rRNA methyltransferase